jgi:hypothetical protein
VDAGAVQRIGTAYSTTTLLKNSVSDIVAIEVKVEKWRDAFHQAIRNQMLSTESYVALPRLQATRAVQSGLHKAHNVGVISIGEDSAVEWLFRPTRRRPGVLRYYFYLAGVVADSMRNTRDI